MRLSYALTGSENIFVESRWWPPKYVHILTHRTCDYVTSHGKRVFADVMKVMDFKLGDYPGGLILITSVLKSKDSIRAVVSN